MKTLLLVSLILSMMVYIGLKFFSAHPQAGAWLLSQGHRRFIQMSFLLILQRLISLVYGDSYRAKVLFSSIPAPVPDF